MIFVVAYLLPLVCLTLILLVILFPVIAAVLNKVSFYLVLARVPKTELQ